MLEGYTEISREQIHRSDLNTADVMKPLITFDSIIDTDVGLIILIAKKYRNPNIFNLELLDSMTVKDLAGVLYARPIENPISICTNVALPEIDELYQDFMDNYYQDVLEYSITTELINTIEIWNKNYIVSEDGIYLVNNNGTQEKKYTNSNLKAATLYNGNIYVLKQEDKNIDIRSISDTFTDTSFLIFNVDNDEICQKIKLFETDNEKIVLIGTNRHLRCIVKSKVDSTIINDKIEFDGTDIVNVSLLEIQNIGESFKVFVTVSNSSYHKFYIYNIY